MNQPAINRTPLGELLETRAQAILRYASLWDADPSGVILRQLALTLDEIRSIRELRRMVFRELLRAECAIGEELMQRYSQPGDKARLQGRLFTIETERRRIAHTSSEQLRVLHQKLLDLLNKYEYLAP